MSPYTDIDCAEFVVPRDAPDEVEAGRRASAAERAFVAAKRCVRLGGVLETRK